MGANCRHSPVQLAFVHFKESLFVICLVISDISVVSLGTQIILELLCEKDKIALEVIYSPL